MSVHGAVSVEATGVGEFARVAAVSVEAGFIRYAVFVSSAAFNAGAKVADKSKWTLVVKLTVGCLHNFLTITGSERITLGRASTDNSVIFGSTDSVLSAGTVHRARVLTTLVYAGHSVRTCVIGSASVNAFAIFANLSRAAVNVLDAYWNNGHRAEGIGIASVSSWTRTTQTVVNGVADCVDAA